jgi:hypothetical protein
MRSTSQRNIGFFGPAITVALVVGIIALVVGKAVVGVVLLVLGAICAAALISRLGGAPE